MTEVNNISVDQAAYNYSISKPENRYESNFESFIAGAQWQKEQLRQLIQFIKDGTDELKMNGAQNVASRIEEEIQRLDLI